MLSVKKLWRLFVVMFFLNISISNAQPCSGTGSTIVLPSKCFEIESILVDACDTCGNSCEGVFEMIRLRVGANSLSVSNFNVAPYVTGNVAWGSGSSTSFKGFCDITSNSSNQAKINTINASISSAGKCGKLIPINSNGTLPAGANVLIFMSTKFSPLTHSFANLSDTLYVLMQCAGNVTGHFSNSSSTSRRLIMTYGSSCSDTVVYLPSLLVDQSGNTPSADGATVNFTWKGSASYANYGCAIPVSPLSVDAGVTSPSYCSGGTVQLSGTIVGSNCYNWFPKNRNSGTFSDSTNLITSFNISSKFSGSCTLYLKAYKNCGNIIDSVTFNVNPTSDSVSIIALTDTVLCNKNTVSLQAIGSSLPVTWKTTGKGTFNQTNIFSPIYTPSINDTSVVWFIISKVTSCATLKDSVHVRFSATSNAQFFISDTVLCQGDAPAIFSTTNSGGVFIGSHILTNKFYPDSVGIYIIKHVVGNTGCKDSASKTIRVSARPKASFKFLSLTPIINETIQFTYIGTTANKYKWAFGDNQYSAIQNPTHTYTNDQKYPVWLTVSNADGCLDSTLLEVDVLAEEYLFVPNVFTPNGDSINDRFVILAKGFLNYQLYIYNRLGAQVFESNDVSNYWNGSSNQMQCSESVYVYMINVTRANGEQKKLHGTVTLLR